jgi:serine/threonine protein phosphatase 1
MQAEANGPRVRRLAQNRTGRDFIAGDIHGAFDLVIQAMKQVSFDASCDRIISVGDMIDRGPDSARVIRFLKKPYVHAVRGNHEENLLALYSEGTPDEEVLAVIARHYSIEWWLTTPMDQRQEILDLIKTLPVAIEIQTRRGLVGVVHGDIPKGMNWPAFLARLESNDEPTLQVALEGRERMLRNDQSGVMGVGRLFVGHTIQNGGPQRYGNVFAVDTGAFLNLLRGRAENALTFANIACTTQVLVPAEPRVMTSVLAVDEEERERPFTGIPFAACAPS